MKAGDRIGGHYQLQKQLGQGATATVWEAVHTVTGHKVAVKIIMAHSPEFRQRLLREARAYGSLRHRNIVEIHNIGETPGGNPFLVMQLLSGETLAEHIAKTRIIEPLRAAQIGRDIANALAAAHQAHIVHRDLKPANIILHHESDMLPGDFILKILDFGVSKQLGTDQSHLTQTGMLIGSPGYMSPEQLSDSGNIDPRSDIWAFGVMMFYMLCGELPFTGTVQEATQKILRAPIPRVSERRPGVPPELDALVAHCLVRDRALRIQSAAELSQRLTAFLQGAQASAQQAPTVSDIEKTWVMPMKDRDSKAALQASPSTFPPSSAPPENTARRSQPQKPRNLVLWIAFSTGAITAFALGLYLMGSSSSPQKPAPQSVLAPSATSVPPPPSNIPPAIESAPAPVLEPMNTPTAIPTPAFSGHPAPAPSTAKAPEAPKQPPSLNPSPPTTKPANTKGGIIRETPF